jgi:hypothetical protein
LNFRFVKETVGPSIGKKENAPACRAASKREKDNFRLFHRCTGWHSERESLRFLHPVLQADATGGDPCTSCSATAVVEGSILREALQSNLSASDSRWPYVFISPNPKDFSLAFHWLSERLKNQCGDLDSDSWTQIFWGKKCEQRQRGKLRQTQWKSRSLNCGKEERDMSKSMSGGARDQSRQSSENISTACFAQIV